MDSALHEVWVAASTSPFVPTIGKDSHFLVGFSLLLLGIALSGGFVITRSLASLPVLGLPASLALAFGVIYMFCAAPPRPIFRAVASSTRPLYQILKSIGFTNKIHVEIAERGLRFAADHARVMQGVAHWGKDLFTSYVTDVPEPANANEETPPSFQISLPALLETLQIFGATDAAARQSKADVDPYRSNLRNYRPDVFSHQVLGISGTCSLSYAQEGEPFSIVLEESGVKTTCNLTTYVAEAPEDIPFDVEDLSFKIITPARVLLDVLGEIAPAQPEKLTITTSRREPYLQFSTGGALGSSSVDFAKGRDLLETFTVSGTWRQTFKFDIIKSATEAMRIASKVSLRGDQQGVLNMQFMVEVEGAGPSFLDFRFVPYAEHEDDEDGDEGAEEGSGSEEL
ncbi:repair protein Rad1/Rec1/Rad17-domain-containing protein [Immersiella caudata]|uniref:Repair protein Rad1/Rec1/Rad17-domain-containing protein n=1 Tax=Immersiella caudata TaxID=314043 RepID=A0AA39XED5_9PEZI|nr:repair protein Rad1/Rec1/Rad17-domain-containing protein [Immersiella caudata]